MTFILAIFRSKLARQIGAIIALFLAVATFGKVQKHKGSVEERRKAKEADNENADRIGDRVRNADSVQPDSDIIYRDK